jgi:hypothetical protein
MDEMGTLSACPGTAVGVGKVAVKEVIPKGISFAPGVETSMMRLTE